MKLHYELNIDDDLANYIRRIAEYEEVDITDIYKTAIYDFLKNYQVNSVNMELEKMDLLRKKARSMTRKKLKEVFFLKNVKKVLLAMQAQGAAPVDYAAIYDIWLKEAELYPNLLTQFKELFGQYVICEAIPLNISIKKSEVYK